MERDTAKTSVWSHHGERENYPKQEQQVLQILSGEKAMTARAIRAEMGRRWKWLELSSAHRAINTLRNNNLIEVAKEDKCPDTNKTVRYYTLAQKNRGSNMPHP